MLYCSRAAKPGASSGSRPVPSRRAATMEKPVISNVLSLVTRRVSGEMPRWDTPKELISPRAERMGWNIRLAVFQGRLPPLFSR